MLSSWTPKSLTGERRWQCLASSPEFSILQLLCSFAGMREPSWVQSVGGSYSS